MLLFVFFCKQKTAYEMRISDWSSDVCSSDLRRVSRWPFDALSSARLWRTWRISIPAATFCGAIEVLATTKWKSPLALRSIQLPAKWRPCCCSSPAACRVARRSVLRYCASWGPDRPRSRCMAAWRAGDTPSAAIAVVLAIASAMATARGVMVRRNREFDIWVRSWVVRSECHLQDAWAWGGVAERSTGSHCTTRSDRTSVG